ncbi:unnamed protein product [Lactuca virosa]|uniref:DUF4283 domain-containing protein n=1 Tax=Lactuca virosa TaxID=75947 RepID=A0AAU9PCF0_9ASTR|nr:unnamed protein product [Lactuca virosa]
MGNDRIWKENLKWEKYGDDLELSFERVGWIRIMGLPLKLWGDHNFVTITGRYGKTISPFDDVYHRGDLSYVKVGILTTMCDRINEEITMATEDKLFKSIS